jgi:hypothetical protein
MKPIFREIALAWRLNAISQGPKSLDFEGPTPVPLALVMELPAWKALRTGLYHRSKNSYNLIVTPSVRELWLLYVDFCFIAQSAN